MPDIDPTDVPFTPEGRERLLALAQEYRAKGDDTELARVLIKLSLLSMQIASDDGSPAPVKAVEFGLRAVAAARKADDPIVLSAALRAAAVPFVTGIDPVAMLEEAVRISHSCGDIAGEAWALFALGKRYGRDDSRERAKELFTKSGEKRGSAFELQTMGIGETVHPRLRRQYFMKAIELFHEAGARVDEYRAIAIAYTFLHSDLSDAEGLQLLERHLELAEGDQEHYLAYLQLERHHRRYGRHRIAEEMRLKFEDLISREYGSVQAYLSDSIEWQIEYADCMQPRHQRASRRASDRDLRRMKSRLRRIQAGDSEA